MDPSMQDTVVTHLIDHLENLTENIWTSDMGMDKAESVVKTLQQLSAENPNQDIEAAIATYREHMAEYEKSELEAKKKEEQREKEYQAEKDRFFALSPKEQKAELRRQKRQGFKGFGFKSILA